MLTSIRARPSKAQNGIIAGCAPVSVSRGVIESPFVTHLRYRCSVKE